MFLSDHGERQRSRRIEKIKFVSSMKFLFVLDYVLFDGKTRENTEGTCVLALQSKKPQLSFWTCCALKDYI
jgi:hypothetical protein